MKRHSRILVLFLLAGVVGGFAVLPVDLPETAFDESDAPVNLAFPSNAPVRFVRPACDPHVMPGLRFHYARCIVASWVPEAVATTRPRHQHSLQDLLSTFLI